MFPYFLEFAETIGYKIELADYQNWYSDLTFVSKQNPDLKFAVDLKTTYRCEDNSEFCNGFTLGSHGEYFINRKSKKNIQYLLQIPSDSFKTIIQRVKDCNINILLRHPEMMLYKLHVFLFIDCR